MKTKLWIVCGMSLFIALTPTASIAADKDAGDSIKAFEIWGKIKDGKTLPSLDRLEAAAKKEPVNNYLCSAASSGESQRLDELLRDGVSADSTDALGVSALAHAVLGDHKNIVIKLIAAGARVNKSGPFGVTPLMLAVNNDQKDLVALLLLNGADASYVNGDGETALIIAKRKKEDVIARLLTPGTETMAPKTSTPQPTIKTSSSTRPLENQNPEELPGGTESPKNTPLVKEATESKPPKAATLPEPVKQESRARKPTSPELTGSLIQAARSNDREKMIQLLDLGADPEGRLPNGLSPLVAAVESAVPETAKVLLENGADPDSVTEFGMTPLMTAVQNGSKDLVSLLLRFHANPQIENIIGESACDFGLASLDAGMRALFSFCPPAKKT